MGQVFSYIWRCIRHPNIEAKTETLQNDPLFPLDLEEQSHYIHIPDGDMVQPDVIPEVPFFTIDLENHRLVQEEEEEEEEEDKDEEAIQKVIQFTLLEQLSHSIAYPGGDTVQPEVITEFPLLDLENNRVEQEEEKEEEEVVEKVIQEVVVKKKEVTSQVLAAASIQECGVSGETVGRIGPYNSMQRILLVGEGDFSFSTSLAVAFGSASNIIATSLNSQGFLIKNYSKFLSNKRELEIRGCMVIHGVNATNMFRHPVLGKLKFDRIIYNFPHTGCFGRSYSDMLKNRNLVRDFVWNAKKMMNEDGEIHITHKSSFFFSLWEIPKVGREQGLHLLEEIDFDCSLFPGYNPKYGFGGDGNFHYDPSKTYKFGLNPK